MTSYRFFRTAFPLLFLFSGCGAGTAGIASALGGSDEPSPTFSLVGTFPFDGEASFDPQDVIRVLFSDIVSPSSVGLDAIRVRFVGADAFLAGESSIDGSVLIFNPAEPLPLLSMFEVEVSGFLAGENGATLGDAQSFQFRTRDGVWGAAQPMFIRTRAIAIDDASVATAVGFVNDPATGTQVHGIRFEGGFWGPRTLLEGASSLERLVAIDSTQRGVVSFLYENDNFAFGGGYENGMWRSQQSDFPLNSFGLGPMRFYVDSYGESTPAFALGVYEKSGIPVGAAYSEGMGWHAGSLLGVDDQDNAVTGGLPVVAALGLETGVALWKGQQATSGERSLFATEYDPVLGWRADEYTELFTFSSPIRELHIEATGESSAVATVLVGREVHSMVYSEGIWGAPEQIFEGADDFSGGELGFITALAGNQTGIGLAVTRIRFDGPHRLVSRRYVEGSGWEPQQDVESLPEGVTAGPVMGVDDTGRALCLWSFNSGIGSLNETRIQAARLVPPGEWAVSETLFVLIGDETRPIAFSMNHKGAAIMSWTDDLENSFSRRFQ